MPPEAATHVHDADRSSDVERDRHERIYFHGLRGAKTQLRF